MRSYIKQIYMPYINTDYVFNTVEVIKVFKLFDNLNSCCDMRNMICTIEDNVFNNKNMVGLYCQLSIIRLVETDEHRPNSIAGRMLRSE